MNRLDSKGSEKPKVVIATISLSEEMTIDEFLAANNRVSSKESTPEEELDKLNFRTVMAMPIPAGMFEALVKLSDPNQNPNPKHPWEKE